MKKSKTSHPQILVGEVVAEKMEKTVAVKVTRRFRHPLYRRPVSRSKKYLVDCREIAVVLGDQVEIQNCRPFSRRKNWRLIKKVSPSK